MSDFGTFSFGRMGGVASSAGSYDIVYSIADAFDGGDNDILGLRISDRYDNMVTYQSPKFSDVQATAQYSFKQDNKSETDTGAEGTSKVNGYASLALTGDFGPLQTVAAYELSKYAKTELHDDTNAFYLGGNCDFRVLKLFATARYTKAAKNFADFKAPADIAEIPGGAKGIDSYGLQIGTIVPVAGGDPTVGLSAHYVYPLCKRTSLYAGVSRKTEKRMTATARYQGRETPRYSTETVKKGPIPSYRPQGGGEIDRPSDRSEDQPFTTSFAAFSPAICPKTKQSRTALPPTRFVPWMPPVISPAA